MLRVLSLAALTQAAAPPAVSSLSLDALIGQMTQLAVLALGEISSDGVFALNESKLEEAFDKYQIGSVLNSPFSEPFSITNATILSPAEWANIVEQIQNMSIAKGSKIPMLYGLDSIHGANYIGNSTLFPQPINGASSFNRDLVQQQGAVTASDTRAVGIHWAFSPILGLAVQPQWPRVFETFGEDPFLVSEMGAAMIKGMQGFPADLSSDLRVAACMKHFFGYSDPRNGHDRSPAWIPERYLQMYFMPPFEAAIKAGVATAMESYGDINGIPLVSSQLYLDTILRGQMKFDGMLVTDWAEINNLYAWHRTASSPEEAVRLALQASSSLDMSMVPLDYNFAISLSKLVNEGKIPRSRLEASVSRILKLKEDLGLFDTPFFANISRIGQPADIAKSLALARESMILLKNDGDLLPLRATTQQTILITGPTADSLRRMNGGWTIHWQGGEDFEFWRGSSLRSYLQQYALQHTNLTIVYEPGCAIKGPCDPAQLNASLVAAATADVIIVAVGEDSYCEKPGDIDDLSLSAGQQQLVTELAQVTTKPIVMVLFEGRPRILHGLADLVPAVILGWLPGPEGGQALTELLFGEQGFSAKLPITYPRDSNAILAPYWHSYSVDTFNPQWQFGHGLSYTRFNYSNLRLSTTTLTSLDTELHVTVNVKNIGPRVAKEVVLLYVSDLYRVVAPEVGMLKNFDKIQLNPGQAMDVNFTLTARQHMWFTAAEGPVKAWEDGAFVVQVGGGPLGSADNLKANFALSTNSYPSKPIAYPSCPAIPPSPSEGVVQGGGTLFVYLVLSALVGALLTLLILYRKHGPNLFRSTEKRYQDIRDK